MQEYKLNDSNAKLRYHDLGGNDIPIIFLHGLGCASSSDYPQVASMKELSTHRRLLIDLLGSGFSDRPDDFGYSIRDHADYLIDFVGSIGLKSFFVYGHSMGGAIAISFADRCRDRLAGIILSESNLDPGGGFTSNKIAAYGEEEYITTGHYSMIEEGKGQENEQWAASLSISYPKAIYRESKSLVEGSMPTWREILYSLSVPKTCIFGEYSLPDPDQEILQNNGVQIEIVQNAGHAMAWENPQGLALAIKKGVGLDITGT
jgi:haloalkane dehalogenase